MKNSEVTIEQSKGRIDVYVNGILAGTALRFAGSSKWHRTVEDFRGNKFNLYHKTSGEAARAIVRDFDR